MNIIYLSKKHCGILTISDLCFCFKFKKKKFPDFPMWAQKFGPHSTGHVLRFILHFLIVIHSPSVNENSIFLALRQTEVSSTPSDRQHMDIICSI